MTTRGSNPSISPPVQIPPTRHVSTISSGTPPPNQQQLYHGQSPGIVQGPSFNYIPQYPQGDQLLSYQAYGSAPNDLRAASAPSGRSGTGPTNMAQSGAFYHQTNQNMRPSQPPPPNQPYYIGGPSGQNTMRHTSRPTHPSNQPMYLIPQNNMVISANMYQPTTRMPLYTQSGPPFNPRYQGQGGVVYYQNAVPRPSVPMQSQGMGPPPVPREKRILTISDPSTGRNITEEVMNSGRTGNPDDKGEQDEISTNDKGVEIRKNFTRQVVERMKIGEATPSPPQAPVESVNLPVIATQNQTSQEQPQLHTYPPVSPTQQQTAPAHASAPGAASMLRPSIRMSSPAINLSVPPPQLPPSVVYSNNRHTQNQQAMSGQIQTNIPVQPPQVMPTKSTLPPSVSGSPAVIGDSVPPARSVENSSSVSHDNMPERKPIPAQELCIPQNDIPTQQKPCVPVSSTTQSENPSLKTIQESSSQSVNQNPKLSQSVQESEGLSATPATSHTQTSDSVQVVDNAAPSVPTVSDPDPQTVMQSFASAVVESKQSVLETSKPAKTEPPIVTNEVKQSPEQETAQTGKDEAVGAGVQGVKDGRKGKKNKKDFNRKESGGSEMDAFIDGKDSGVDSESGQIADQIKSENQTTSLASPQASISKVEDQTSGVEKVLSPQPTPTVAVEPPVKKPEEYIAEKETEVVKPQTIEKENVAEPSQNRIQMDKQASVPKDDGLSVNSEEDRADSVTDSSKADDECLPEENGTSKIEDIELSKAKAFAELKKSGGKLVYDRAYLMELRECASSQTKPDGLPKLEIILDKPDPLLYRTSGGPVDFTPSFFQTGANQRHAPPIGKSSSRGRQRPGDMPVTPRVIKSISMSNDVKQLHQSENPWKPAKKEEKDEQKGLEGEILYIMNRLTPTNFEKMAIEMKKLGVKTYENLQFMVKTFFDKATIETKFVEAYAQLCKVMSGLKVPPPPDGTVKENMATFRVVMLTKCQQEFESDKSIIFENPEEKKKKLEAEHPEVTPERNEMIEKILYQMKLRRMKFYGNIRFIGELFKLGMLTENIMHDCIFRLLKAKDDDSLVSLCNLLTTVGRNLDTEKAKGRMDQYFIQMSKIADERKSRIKFTLKDVIDLRQNDWVPRKETTGPKKIDEVHKDFAQEQARNQYLASQPPPPRNDNSQAGSRRGSRQRPDEKPNDEGWNTVATKVRIDASKMKISKGVVDEANIQLGPGGGLNRPLWSRGSHGGAQPSQDDRPPFGSNRFTALTSDDTRRSYPRSPSRGEGSAGRGMRQGPTAGHGRGKIMSRSSQEGEKRDNRSFMGGRSQNSSRDNSWNRDDRRQFMGPRSSGERENLMTRSDSGVQMEEFRVPAPPAVKQMKESEIETKAVNILDEYLNIRDKAEAKLCMKELGGQNFIYLVVTACINNVLEKKEEARHLTGDLFHDVVNNNIITQAMFIKGLNEVLQDASDMVVDIPTLWSCLAQVICPLLVGGSLPWSKLKQALSPHLDNKDGAKLLAAILSQSVEKQGEKEVLHQWQTSGLSWSSYLRPDEVHEFVQDKKLGFTLGTASSHSSLGGGDLDKLMDLEKMIRNKAASIELINYIEKTVPGSKTDNSFIRALTTAFVNASIGESKKLKEEVFKKHKDVLLRYIGNKVDLQLQALFAIQTLMNKLEHPSGILPQLFELMYNEISVDEEAFYKWEKCDDPQEQEAKGICLMQVGRFYVWLRENDEPES